MDYYDRLIMLGKEMREKSQIMHKKLTHVPKGSILITGERGNTKVYQLMYEGQTQIRVGIKRKPELIKGLARKAYYLEMTRRLDNNIDILRKAVAKMTPLDSASILRSMPSKFELLDSDYYLNRSTKMHPVYDPAISPVDYSLYIPENQQEGWGERPYRANALYAGQIQNRTEEGFYVRSKNEMAIFSCYKKLDIPVHYDELIRFSGDLKSPDFVSLRMDGKVIYHEHCGLVNNSEYMKKHKEKIALYESCGIVPYSNLIITYENEYGGIDMNLIEAQIKSMHHL